MLRSWLLFLNDSCEAFVADDNKTPVFPHNYFILFIYSHNLLVEDMAVEVDWAVAVVEHVLLVGVVLGVDGHRVAGGQVADVEPGGLFI